MNFDNDILSRAVNGGAILIGALAGALVAFYGNLRIKQFEHQTQRQKDNASQRLKFYLPLLRFCYDLDKRLKHVLNKLHSDWLAAAHLNKIRDNKGFATDPNEKGYFIMSSIYMLACFFGWCEAIKKGVDSTKSAPERNGVSKWLLKNKKRLYSRLNIRDKASVFLVDPNISLISRLFQHEELFNDYMTSKKLTTPRDACKMHKHVQYSIGELMLEKDGQDNFRCKSFKEFFDAYLNDNRFRYSIYLPLENLLIDLVNFQEGKDIETQVEIKNDIRPLRLLAIRYWCSAFMKDMAQRLDIEMPPQDDILKGVSEELKRIIISAKPEALESYLLGK